MNTKYVLGAILAATVTLAACYENKPAPPTASQSQPEKTALKEKNDGGADPKTISKDEWRKRLDPQQYAVTCEGSTEPPFTGKYWDHHEPGTYHCVRCGAGLFSSDTKFDSASGWPSYTAPIQKEGVTERVDDSLYGRRMEVVCSHCGAHLGHVFPDGPKPTGLRYCINSSALNFEKKK